MKTITNFSTLKIMYRKQYLLLTLVVAAALLPGKSNAQNWGNGAGNGADQWTINDDNSNNWSFLRLQTDNDRAWNMVNQGHLWWGYAPNSNHSDRGTEKMRLDTNGNLTIGGTLKVNGTGSIHLTHNTGNSGAQRIYMPGHVYLAPYNSGNIAYVQARRGDDSGSTEMRLRTYNNGQLTEAMHLDSQGKVGIGTTTPGYKLHVRSSGNQLFRLTSETSGTWMDFENTAAPSGKRIWSIGHRGGTGDFGIYQRDGIDAYRFLITDDGKVGIGTTNPTEKLQVAGVISSQGLRIPGRYDFGQSSSGIEMEVPSGSYNAIRGYNGSQVAGKIHFFDDTWGAGAPGKSAGAINISGAVATTIGPWSNPTAYFRSSDGNVGIGTPTPSEKLDVAGNVKANGVILNIGTFPDYVFQDNYPLMPLGEVERYIKANKHLPDFPSEAEVVKDGANLGQLNNLLVEKVEELTLYTIAQEKQIDKLSNTLASLQAKLNELLKKQ